jgi:hypothetical protein
MRVQAVQEQPLTKNRDTSIVSPAARYRIGTNGVVVSPNLPSGPGIQGYKIGRRLRGKDHTAHHKRSGLNDWVGVIDLLNPELLNPPDSKLRDIGSFDFR